MNCKYHKMCIRRLYMNRCKEPCEHFEPERPHGEWTTESAIDYLTNIGWLPEHDRVLTETTHGEWIEERDKRGHLISRKCPLCKAYHDGMLINFCPNCGALMAKEGEAE